MSEIKRVPFEASDLHDAVELKANCSVIRVFTKDGAVTGVRGKVKLHPCKLMASYEEGTLTISTPEIGMMVSIRLDEAMAVMKEAAAAALDAADPVKPKMGGPYSLYCEKCRCWVSNTANHEMKREGGYAHSHICGHRQPGEVYEEESDVQKDAAAQG